MYFQFHIIQKKKCNNELEEKFFPAWYTLAGYKIFRHRLNNKFVGAEARRDKKEAARNIAKPARSFRKVAALRVYTPSHFRVDTDLRRTPREISVSWNPYTHTYTHRDIRLAKAGSNIHGMKTQSDKVPPIKFFAGKTVTWTEYSPSSPCFHPAYTTESRYTADNLIPRSWE